MLKTMSDTDRLFDLTDYGGNEPTPHEIERTKLQLPIEPHRPPWQMIRNQRGPLPYFHLLRGVNGFGSASTLCGKQGTVITNLGVDQMIRCPECDLSSQVDSMPFLH